MDKSVTSNVKRALQVIRRSGEEVLRAPGEIAGEGAKSVGLGGGFTPQEVREFYGVANRQTGEADQGGGQVSADQQLAAARAKMSALTKSSSEWWRAEQQAIYQHQQRVNQIVEAQLGHTPEGKPAKEVEKEREKREGVLGKIAGAFKGRRSRRMQGAKQASQDASGEFSKGHQ